MITNTITEFQAKMLVFLERAFLLANHSKDAETKRLMNDMKMASRVLRRLDLN
jgi:hypothetical protein